MQSVLQERVGASAEGATLPIRAIGRVSRSSSQVIKRLFPQTYACTSVVCLLPNIHAIHCPHRRTPLLWSSKPGPLNSTARLSSRDVRMFEGPTLYSGALGGLEACTLKLNGESGRTQHEQVPVKVGVVLSGGQATDVAADVLGASHCTLL